ncbi:hypothetical protein EVAR_65859_1 [Eumeta japonica]|uniref:Uncharacterized protein n=1 Tax=Eumeta variegata TaxID=151549 RepID=A0A4C1ZH24_EUMVA|nr:hypothetical protein EVAR_65859_1 [Eumeta japonica]
MFQERGGLNLTQFGKYRRYSSVYAIFPPFLLRFSPIDKSQLTDAERGVTYARRHPLVSRLSLKVLFSHERTREKRETRDSAGSTRFSYKITISRSEKQQQQTQQGH